MQKEPRNGRFGDDDACVHEEQVPVRILRTARILHVETKDDGSSKTGDLRVPLLALYFYWAKDPAICIQLIEDLSDKCSTYLTFSRDRGYRSRGILLKAAQVGRSDLELLLIAVQGARDKKEKGGEIGP
jgi:hypothetical protein